MTTRLVGSSSLCGAILVLVCAVQLAVCLPPPQQEGQQPPKTSSPPDQTTQPPADDAYLEQRKFAFSLFNANHRLEALPVFEDLAKKNPNDPQVLFGLEGVSLTIQRLSPIRKLPVRNAFAPEIFFFAPNSSATPATFS